jgi:maltoporin
MGAYVRSFRDASEGLNFEDVDEGIVVARPTFFIGEIAGVSLEGAFEMAQRGVITANPEDPSAAPEGPFVASLWRVGLMPFISPAGRGNFSRPHIRAIYNVAFRDESAKLLYPVDDGFRNRSVEHFIGLGAEWWFNSSSYGF